MKQTILLFCNVAYTLMCTLSAHSQTQLPDNIHDNGLHFTENKGQIADRSGKLRPDVLFRGEGGCADIYIRKTGISYVYNNRKDLNGELSDSNSASQRIRLHRVDMDFVDCNNNIYVTNEDELEGYTNYYLAQCPKGVTHVKQYNKVTCRNIYPDIDVTYYGNRQKGLEYDLIIKQGADPKKIKLNWSGAEKMHINSAGNLVIKTSVNEFYVSIPKAYQDINGERIFVKAQYVLTSGSPTVNSQSVTFKMGSYNRAYPLIIDPLTWISYFGGTEEDLGLGVAVDRQHNVIFCGYTESPDLPVSPGAYDVTLGGFSDGWIAKFNAQGARLWATYIGGSAKDECRGGIAIDSNNNIFVTSVTWSTDFPTMAWGGAYMQLVNNSTTNGTAYVAQFTSAGALTWCTYYGGSTADWGVSIAIDALQDIIIAGNTSSNDFPVLNAYQAVKSGGQDAYIVKFNSAGVRQWATFYGGTNTESTGGITTDAGDNIYLSGTTSSGNFPVVAAYQGVYGGGPDDAFLVKFNTTNANPVWSTYYGGSGDDLGVDVAADALGNVFLGLKTSSANAITTAGSYQPALSGNYDGAVIKFTNSETRVWGTYIGGTQQDGVTGVAVDMNNNISVSGNTQSSNFPVTSCAFQTTYQGSQDMIMAKLNQQGRLLCSTFITNGSSFSIAVDGVYAYINGGTTGNLPATEGAFQTTYAGAGSLGDAAFVKLCSYSCDTTAGVSTIASFEAVPASSCSGSPVSFVLTNSSCDTSNTTYSWSFTGGTPAVSAAQNPVGITWSAPGTYVVSVSVISPCDSTVTLTGSLTISSGVAFSQSFVLCTGQSITVGSHTYTATGIYKDTLTANGGCDSIVTTNLTVSSSASAIVTPGGPTTFCAGDDVTLTVNAAESYLWSNGDTTQSITVFSGGIYSVTVNDSGCSGTSTAVTVTVNPAPPPPTITARHDTLFCSTDPTYVTYQWYDSSVLVPGATDTFFVYTNEGNYNVKVTNTNGCVIAVGINISTGINELYTDDNISLSPNPATNQVTIHTSSFHNEAVMVSVGNVLGQEVSPTIALQMSGENAVIDVSKLARGMYFVEIKSESVIAVRKFVKE